MKRNCNATIKKTPAITDWFTRRPKPQWVHNRQRIVHTITLIAIMTMILFSTLSAQVITVKQDGTGDFTSIQPAIDSTGYGDTVLVWPGTYFENLNLNGHNITLASLNLTTGDPSYIDSTIIDGSHVSSCIVISSGEQFVRIMGFTIQHGGGNVHGGGIRAFDMYKLWVTNCIIKNNAVNGGGGGIAMNDSRVYLSGVTICHNHAYSAGGGIAILQISHAIFDTVNKCNIYLNYANLGCDIHSSFKHPVHVVVDTFTVLNPDTYFLSSIDELGFQNGLITYDIQHQKIQPVNNDLYVSPYGSDTNSGLNPEESLGSLSFALTKIVSDSTHPNTIHLANGTYSPSLTDEKYPLNVRSYITVQGENRDSAFLDGDSLIYILRAGNETGHFAFKNLTIQNGNGITNTDLGIGLMRLYVVDNVLFENVSLTGGTGDLRSTFSLIGDKVTFKNVEIFENYGGKPHIGIHPLAFVPGWIAHDTVDFINCKYYNNHPSPIPGNGSGDGIFVSGTMEWDNSMTVNFIGCEFSDNVENFVGQFATTCLSVYYNSTVNLVNSTLGNNICMQSPAGYAIGMKESGKLNIYNSIIYGNVNGQISLFGDTDFPNELNIYSSLIQDGLEGIHVEDPVHTIYYDPTNIDTDPLWDTASEYPYSLSEGSPCIDAGTLNLPTGIELPEYDIAGNPRIWGESVDMGAYEYGPWVRVPSVPNSKFQIPNSKLLEVSPNPFEYGTYIRYELQEKGRLNISVYSLAGRKVKTLIHSSGLPGETGKFYWDGHDEQGHELPAGTYIIRMTVEDRLVDAVKVVRG